MRRLCSSYLTNWELLTQWATSNCGLCKISHDIRQQNTEKHCLYPALSLEFLLSVLRNSPCQHIDHPFKAVYLFIVWLSFNLFNYYSTDEHYSCFHFLLPPIINNALKNIFVYTSVWFSVFLGYTIRGRVSGTQMTLYIDVYC